MEGVLATTLLLEYLSVMEEHNISVKEGRMIAKIAAALKIPILDLLLRCVNEPEALAKLNELIK